MVTVALILAAAVLTLTGAVASLAARLRAAKERADLNADLADTFLSMLRKAGVVNTVTSCERSKERAK